MLVRESIGDLLKPKDANELKGQKFYAQSSMTGLPEFVFEVTHVLNTFIVCKVLYNSGLIEGGSFFDTDAGQDFSVRRDDFRFVDAKPLNEDTVKRFDYQIELLEDKKKRFLDAIS